MNLQSSLTAFVKKLICNISFDLNVPPFKTGGGGGGGVKNVKQITNKRDFQVIFCGCMS